ncbi:MAG: alpha-L-fucosidase [Christensenellaceae bacterium]|jgi:alpha-L-fucosidase|nr:alpha-L-fucosidase [Christensenellaceae bacterium]
MSIKLKTFLKKYAVFIMVVLLITAIITITILVTNYNAKYNYYEIVETKYDKPEDSFSNVFATTNNGYPTTGESVESLQSAEPSYRQLEYMGLDDELEYFALFNFGMSTFSRDHTSTGKEDPSSFNPPKIEILKWFETLVAADVNVAVLNVKSDDGFCLWPTKTTTHSIEYSSYRGGKEDLIQSFKSAAEDNSMKVGLYYSLYDKNASTYGTDDYNDFVVAQLSEITDRDVYKGTDGLSYIFIDDTYGPNVSDSFEYDYERYIEVLRTGQQMKLAISFRNYKADVDVLGYDIDALSENIWSVVDKDNPDHNNSSRDDLANATELAYIAPQLIVNLRSKDYYDPYDKPKSLDLLKQLYFKSVGYNTSFMLVLYPNDSGDLASDDVQRLEELGEAIKRSKSASVSPTKMRVLLSDHSPEIPDMISLTTETDSNFLFPDTVSILEFEFTLKTQFGRIDIRENLTNKAPLVEAYEIWVYNDGWKLVADRGNIGNRSIVMLKNAPKTFKVRLVIKQSRGVPDLRTVIFYEKK